MGRLEKKTVVVVVMAIAFLFWGTGRIYAGEITSEDRESLISGDYEYVMLDDGTVEIVRFHGSEEILEIPDTIEGYAVTSIGNEAFFLNNCSKEIVIPEGVTKIGDNAFGKSFILEDITIPESVIEIGSNPFMGCPYLFSINVYRDHPTLALIDGVLFSKTDHRLVFYPQMRHGNYVIPEGTKKIGNRAFWGCQNLTDVVLPVSITSIGDEAFANCTRLMDFNIPDCVTDFGDSVFYSCRNLSSIQMSVNHSVFEIVDDVLIRKTDHCLVWCPTSKEGNYVIPQGVEKIGNYAFAHSQLTKITLPDGIKSIGEGAFRFCITLKEIHLPESITSIADYEFVTSDDLTVSVTSGSYAEQYCKEFELNYTKS